MTTTRERSATDARRRHPTARVVARSPATRSGMFVAVAFPPAAPDDLRLPDLPPGVEDALRDLAS